ncbi:MAG TPA: DegT/DnrJ/EryC1/StrS family aminotransferase [Acidimicrobiales bacterium]|nr:DegT/DnrJ/EryC1/StrS family aminotransferase [Acidimicrobiales bacterium]
METVDAVSFLDLKAASDELGDELGEAMARVVASGRYVLGPEVEQLESEFAGFVGARHCVGVANGLDALHLGLRALGVGPGDEVIVPANTYVATWLAVSWTGATPVPVEPDEVSFNITADLIEPAITSRTKVILPVHLYGQPADIEPINRLADTYGLRVLDDAAQAHGSRYGGRRIGGLTDLTAWSFYPGKNLGALGDGGAITTNDADLADQVRILRNYGSRRKYDTERQGLNSRLDEIQAAVLRVKLRHLDEWNDRRTAVAASYHRGLADSGVVVPQVSPGCDPVWHLYVVRTPVRPALQAHLAGHAVQTLIHYPIPPYRQGPYLGQQFGPLELSDRLHDEVLSLPIGPHLGEESVERVVDAVSSFTECEGAS